MAEVSVSFFPSLVCSPSVVLVASIVYYQLSEVYPGEWHFNAACAHARTHAHCCRTDNILQAITMIPNPLPANLVDHPLYPALTTAVRDLATSNIMTAVMLTGLILLQVCRARLTRILAPVTHLFSNRLAVTRLGDITPNAQLRLPSLPKTLQFPPLQALHPLRPPKPIPSLFLNDLQPRSEN